MNNLPKYGVVSCRFEWLSSSLSTSDFNCFSKVSLAQFMTQLRHSFRAFATASSLFSPVEMDYEITYASRPIFIEKEVHAVLAE